MSEWALQDAKNRFSAVVNAALAGKPQRSPAGGIIYLCTKALTPERITGHWNYEAPDTMPGLRVVINQLLTVAVFLFPLSQVCSPLPVVSPTCGHLGRIFL